MKTIKIRKVQDYVGIKSVRIANDMAPLTILPAEGNEVIIEAELSVQDSDEEFVFEDHVQVNYADHELTIEFDECSELRESYFGVSKSSLKVFIPQGIEIKAESDNLPLFLHNLESPLEVSNENGPISVNNCQGVKELENENGPIKIHNCSGNLSVKLENGPLSAEALQGEELKVESENGAVKLRDCSFGKVEIRSENGVIYYESLPVEDGDFSFENENGVVNLVLPDDFDFELDAETELGTLRCGFEAEITKTDGHYHVLKGEGKTKIRIKTENGVIKLGSDEHMNLSFLKMKLGQLKEKLAASKTLEDKEQVLKVMETVFEQVEKAISSIEEQKIKDGVTGAMDKLKVLVAAFDVNEAKDKVIQSVDKISSEVVDGLKVVIRKVKDQKEHVHHPPHPPHPSFHFEFDNLKDYIHKVVDSELVKPYLGKGLSGKEKGEVDERSRLKILEMLESGKITAEEAERLLKAIGKE